MTEIELTAVVEVIADMPERDQRYRLTEHGPVALAGREDAE